MDLPTKVFIEVTLLVMAFVIRDNPYRDDPLNRKDFDFIVVGGGSAGCVVASRMAELLPSQRILLIEAGGEPTLQTKIPWFYSVDDPDIEWNYETEPSEHGLLGIRDRKFSYKYGRVLGGTGGVLGSAFVRGNRADYEEWDQIVGNQGWGYEDLLEVFKEMESVDANTPFIDGEYRGHDGPIKVQHPQFRAPIADVFLQAGNELGYEAGDYNGKNQSVFSYWQFNIRDGLRSNTEKEYLRPASDNPERSNLKISYNTLVHKVVIDDEGSGKRATAVIVEKEGQLITLEANKEIVLSAGTIGSAQLLLLSGVGPEDHLKELEIPVNANLDVGRNFQDQLAVEGLTWFVNDANLVYDVGFYRTVDTIREYALQRTGPLSRPIFGQSIAFVHSGLPSSARKPDIQLYLSGSTTQQALHVFETRGFFTDEVWEGYLSLWCCDKPAFRIQPLIRSAPNSKGFLKLRSKDIKEMPIIQPNYLKSEDDIKVLVEGIKIAVRVGESAALRTFNPQFSGLDFPFCNDKFQPGSDEYWACYVKWMAVPDQNAVGTCRMGPDYDSRTVVDSKFRVRNIAGLRVADASVIPKITTGSNYATVIAIGYRAATFIADDHSERR